MRKRSVVSPITTLTVFLLLLTSTFTIMTLIPPVHAQGPSWPSAEPGDILVIDYNADIGYGPHGALFRVDPSTGARTIFNDMSSDPYGQAETPDAVAVSRDLADIYVIDSAASIDTSGLGGRLNRMDPSTGIRTPGMHHSFNNWYLGKEGRPVGLDIEPSGNILVVSDIYRKTIYPEDIVEQGALFRVDASRLTEDDSRTILTDFSNPDQGPLGEDPQDVAVDATGNIVLVDRSAGTDSRGALFSVSPSTGSRTLLSDFGNSVQGPLGSWLLGVAFDASCNILVVDTNAGTDARGALFSVSPSTGSRTLLSDFGNSAQGPLGLAPRRVAVDAAGNILVVDINAGTDARGALFSVSPSTGSRTLLSDFGNSAQGSLGVSPADVAVFDEWQPSSILPGVANFKPPASVAFDGVDILYFTALDPAYFDPTFAGRVWSIRTDGTGLTTVADLPGGVPQFPGEFPRNIVALAYDSSRDGLWLSVSPVCEIHFLDLSTLEFSYRFNPPAAACGALNAPNGLAHDPVTDTLFFSAFDGLTIYQTEPLGNPIRSFDLETFFRGGNNGMAWDGEKLWLARMPGNFLANDFIGTFDVNPDLPAGTPRAGGPTFTDAGAPNDLAFDNVTFLPNCALWATPTDGTAALRAYEVPCPLGEAPDTTIPTATCGEPWPPGNQEISFQDLESGLAYLFLIGDPATRNAEITIPPFAEGTTSVVIVTVERINHDLESRVALRAVDVRGNARSIGCLIPAGMIGTLLGEASTPTDGPVTVEIDGVTVTFDEVTESGTTSVIVHDDGPPPPSGFMLGDPPTYFDVSTTATYSGQVMVCIDYSGITFDDEAALSLGHYENGMWVDRTISLDMENNIICALVDSLSFFTALESEVPGAPPVADPNGPYTGTAGVPMQFTGAGSSDPDGTIVSYDWDFGDGGTGTGVFPTHTYASDGLYTVTLTVTDDDGLTDTAATTAEIGEAPVEPEPPVAIFTEDLHIAIVGQPITLDPSSSYDPDGSIVLYEWDFDGDGIYDLSTITPDMVSNAWGALGTYTVTLRVTDDDGLTDTATDTKTITTVAIYWSATDENLAPLTIDLAHPVGTHWHEIYPTYSQEFDLTSWVDNGDSVLSASDEIDVVRESTGETEWYHVDEVTITIHFTFKPPDEGTGDAEPVEPVEPESPIGTVWHMVYPDYSREFTITSWEDTDGSGTFNPSDQFDFEFADEPGVIHWAHLDAVSTDLVLTAIPPPLRTIESCDSTGTKKDTFDIPEDVYVIGSGYSALTSYDLYVVDDVDWTDGMAIPSRVSGTAASVTSDASGNIPATPVWTGPLVLGKYDIVVDVDGDGIYYEEVDALDDGDIQVTAGFLVIPEVALGTIMASAAMIIALVAYVTMPKWRKKQQYAKP